MKSLHKKIGIVALVGMIVSGGFAACKINVNADSISNFSFNQSDDEWEARNSLYVLQRREFSKHEFKIVDYDFKGKGNYYGEKVMEFRSGYEFFEQIQKGKRESYGIVVGKECIGRIGILNFKFIVLK